MDWYRIANPETLDTPALVVFPERVKENIRAAIAMTGSADRLRPHVKTHKSPDCTRLQLAAGITRFKCATIAEAEMLAMEEAPDVLLAYQPIGPKAQRLAGLIKKYPRTSFSCLIDHPDAATAMAKIFATAGLDVPVYLDINVGLDRTGIAPGDEAIKLYQLAAKAKGITPVGLHAYDGHIRDTDLAERTRKCNEGFDLISRLNQTLGLTIIAGGSPTFPIHAKRAKANDIAKPPAVPEVQCSPGTFVYWDKGYGDSFPDQPFQPAALVVTRVISKRSDTRLCLDLGHKSIAPENELSRRVFFLNGPDLKPVGQSEEHLVVETDAAAMHRVGDVFYGVPYHVCPTIALYDRAFTIEDGRVTGSWKNSARDRIITI